MLSYTAKSKLADLIGVIAENERQIETRRQLLAEEPLFSPYVAYGRLDKYHSGYITSFDVKEYLRQCGMFASTTEAESLANLFGDSIRQRLYKEDFYNLVLSANPLLKARALDRDRFSYGPLSLSVEIPLARVFQAVIDGNNRAATHISTLKSCYDCSAYDAFRELDRYKSGYITISDLSIFLKLSGSLNRYDDAELFVRHLDKDKDGRLSYSEFVNGLDAIAKKPSDIYAKYSYSEKKPSYRSRYESPKPRTEYNYRPRRFGSEERYSSSFNSPLSSSYISPHKTFYESPYRKEIGRAHV